MVILSFDEPKKVRSHEEHSEMFVADSAPPGVYIPNMSEEDRLKWKAKHIKGSDERVEIKKGFGGTQVVIVVYKNTKESNWHERIEGHDNVRISANSKIHMTFDEYEEFKQAIDEAKTLLLNEGE